MPDGRMRCHSPGNRLGHRLKAGLHERHGEGVAVPDVGERVSAGQVIAKMGSSGATHVMLHFEIRRAGKPVDPMRYLPRRPKHRFG